MNHPLHRIPDPTVLGIQLSGNPIIGEAEMININYRHTCEGPNSRRQIRVRCTGPTGHQPVFELLEVKSFEAKDIVYDCLYLEGCVLGTYPHMYVRMYTNNLFIMHACTYICGRLLIHGNINETDREFKRHILYIPEVLKCVCNVCMHRTYPVL